MGNSFLHKVGYLIKKHKWSLLVVGVSAFLNQGRVTKLRICGMRVGGGSVIRPSLNHQYIKHIEIGRNTLLGESVFLIAGPNSKIRIGDDVLVAPNVYITTTMHRYTDPQKPIRLQGGIEADIIIEDDVWIGTGSTILQGLTIGKHAVIAAGSVVTRSVEPYDVVAGVPARLLKRRGQ